MAKQDKSPDQGIQVTSDTSGRWECGAIWGHQWIPCKWDTQWLDVNIAAKELLPIMLACAVWSKQWWQQRVLIHCDNMAVVAVWGAQSSKHQLIMHLLHCLHFVCAYFEIDLHIEHISRSENVVADAVPRQGQHYVLGSLLLSFSPLW